MKLTEAEKRVFVRNVLIQLINALNSAVEANKGYLKHKEKRLMTVTSKQLDKILDTVKKQVTPDEYEALEKRTDLDFAYWVHSHVVPQKDVKNFHDDFINLVKKYANDSK